MANNFTAAINAFISKSEEKMEAVTKVTFIKILARLVMMSPVGNPSIWQVNAKIAEKGKGKERKPAGYTGGRFRGNWQVTFDEVPMKETGRIDKSGEVTQTEGNLVIGQFKVGMKSVYFSNVVPYAYRLEMGHSKQAPKGMIRIMAQEFQPFFHQAIAERKG
ncbi:hypothetical protein [Candidatus Arsenophonus nilaparvatae]|uniref:hypothetical protein n=1 Tax=Candidatus Arsenophonus nilaparvatae TaxID=1247023 RepID=UPI000509790C|nr:hypothetical protein [Candidatus Arsenophonus nilaparvatae]